MEIEIISKLENPMLSRTEIKFKVKHEEASTPTRESVAGKLAAMLNADRKRTILLEVQGQFGVQWSLGKANVYENEETAMSVEPKYLLKRNGLISEE